MEPIPKVPKSQFDAVLSKLLAAPPMPLTEMPRKRERRPKAKTGLQKRVP